MSKTQENLMAGFAGESQATRKYQIYSEVAEKEGKLNAAKLFQVTAEAEKIHSKKEFEVAGMVGDTMANLKDAKAGETYEFSDMYPEFIQEAEKEGNKRAIQAFEYAKEAEKVHADLYQDMMDNIDSTEEVFYYLCPVCGNIEKSIPEKCYICNVPGTKFIKY